MKNFLFAILIISINSQSIYLGLKARETRCMIEYIAGSGLVNTVKIQITLPKIDNAEMGQHFYISIRNTESNHTISQAAKPGTKFLKQEQFTQNDIYEVCITFRTKRDLDVVIEYETENVYNYKQQTIKVPENLLKKDDFKEAFIAAAYIENTMQEYNLEHYNRNKNDNKQFNLTQDINQNLMIVSVVELFVLVSAGLYQFFALKQYLSTKQYI